MLTALSGGRYTIGWSVGRLFWAASACVLFIYFLGQFRIQQRQLARARDRLEEDVALRTAELSRQTTLLSAVSEGTSDLLFVKDRDGRLLFANPATARILGLGREEVIGRTGLDGHAASDRRVIERGEAETIEEIFSTPEGPRTYLSTKAPMRDAAGVATGLIGVSRDITERKLDEENTRTLLLEVSHRAKNILAVVQGMVRLSAREDDAWVFADSLAGRLEGLATSHDLLVTSAWRGVDIGELVEAQLRHLGEPRGGRIRTGGPAMKLEPGCAQTIGMALHELATNALKYGALKSDEGRVALDRSLGGGKREGRDFRMSWVERGGPPSETTVRQGYGHSVVVRMVEHALDAEVILKHGPEGLEWHVSAPAQRVLVGLEQAVKHERTHSGGRG